MILPIESRQMDSYKKIIILPPQFQHHKRTPLDSTIHKFVSKGFYSDSAIIDAKIMCDCWDEVEFEEILAARAKRKESLPIVQEFEEPIVVEVTA